MYVLLYSDDVVCSVGSTNSNNKVCLYIDAQRNSIASIIITLKIEDEKEYNATYVHSF